MLRRAASPCVSVSTDLALFLDFLATDQPTLVERSGSASVSNVERSRRRDA